MIGYEFLDDAVLFTSNSGTSCGKDETLVFSILQELVDNGFAQFVDGDCRVSMHGLYSLTNSDLVALGLPKYYESKILLKANNLLKSDEFSYKLSFCKSKNGDRFKINRCGALISYNNDSYLLTHQQYELVSAVDIFNSKPKDYKTFGNNLKDFSKIKKLAIEAEVYLDKYLESENVASVDNIKLNLNRPSFEQIEVVPSIDHAENEQFVANFDKLPSVSESIPVTINSNDRLRFVLEDSQKEVLNTIKNQFRRNRYNDENIVCFIEHPEMFIDPECCDLSELYSDRVIEIGLYKPKFSAFISPYKSSWLPEFTIEDRVNGTSRLTFKTEEEIDEFERCIDIAENKGLYSVTYNNIVLNTDDAREIARRARKVFEDKRRKDEKKKQEENKVLLIEENDEELGYSVPFDVNADVQSYTLEKVDGLRSGIMYKEHQMEGIAWLQYMMRHKAKGCLLADDMGLGKTLQLLSVINWHSCRFKDSDKPYLIVAPISLLENWGEEYCKFFEDRIPVYLAISSELRMAGADNTKFVNGRLVAKLQKRQIILTNYETLRRFQFTFCAVDYAMTILDEAQKVKTPGTMVTNSVKALKSDFRVAMTGTPVENTLVDLWCIMDYAIPGLLGNCKEFSHNYQTPMKNPDVDIIEMGNCIRNRMGRYFMRRIKADVAKDLPNKYLYKCPQDMPDIQYHSYVSVINEAIEERDKGFPSKGYMLICLQKLRGISDHPLLGNDMLLNESVEKIIHSSAKLIETIHILDQIKIKNEKVIVFTDRKEMQRILQHVLTKLYNINPRIINGDTQTVSSEVAMRKGKLSRQQAIHEFQSKEGFNVIIMSPIAAGMGLNVTEANHVIHYSRHWNPAKEEQATDRAYRIGQQKDVQVYFPMAVIKGIHTFDETLDELLAKKSKLASATLFPTERTEVKVEELFLRLLENSVQTA